MISIANNGEISVAELVEREMTGATSNTIDYDHILDTTVTVEDSYPLYLFMEDIGIIFLSLDNVLSLFYNDVLAGPEFREASTLTIESTGILSATLFKEV